MLSISQSGGSYPSVIRNVKKTIKYGLTPLNLACAGREELQLEEDKIGIIETTPHRADFALDAVIAELFSTVGRAISVYEASGWSPDPQSAVDGKRKLATVANWW